MTKVGIKGRFMQHIQSGQSKLAIYLNISPVGCTTVIAAKAGNQRKKKAFFALIL